jgi:hypothetical protein
LAHTSKRTSADYIDGEGFFQEKGKPARTIKKGDVLVAAENTEHLQQ